MKYYLKTKEECDAVVARNDAFLRADRVVEGFNVAIYDYRLASIGDFVDDEAFELRGLTFVENPETGEWERNLLLQKFFNYSQTEGWMPEDLDNKKITRVQNKEDGSIISFVKFPNGSIRAKSKTSFESDQAKMAQEFFDRKSIMKEEVDYLLSKGKTPVFELVSPENQIVLEYQKTELVLLQIRNEDGTYMSEKDLKWYSMVMCVNQAKVFDIDDLLEKGKEVGAHTVLDTLLYYKKTSQENIEGWVVTFEDGQMAKIKTDHYIQLHGIIGPDAFRENLLIQTILDGNMDDVIAQLVPGEKKDKMIEMDRKIVHNFNHLINVFKGLRGKYFNEFSENRKEFALKYSKEPLFGYVMKSLNTSFRDVNQVAEVQVRAYMNKYTNSLGKAKEYIEGL